MTDDLGLGADTPLRAPSLPVVDEAGLLRVDGAWVVLPIAEIEIARALVESFDHLVSRTTVMRAAWPEGGGSRATLNTRIYRLRHRITPLDLTIRTVRARGFIMTWRS